MAAFGTRVRMLSAGSMYTRSRRIAYAALALSALAVVLLNKSGVTIVKTPEWLHTPGTGRYSDRRVQAQLPFDLAAQYESTVGEVDAQAKMDVNAYVPRDIDPDDPATWPAPTPALPDEATLEQRLAAWASTPISTADKWMTYNSAALPHVRSYQNRLWGFVSAVEDSGGPWERLWRDPGRMQRMRDEMMDHLRKVDADGRLGPSHQGEGRGIVIVAGNVDTIARAKVTVKLLRNRLNSSLPVQIACFEDELPDEGVIADFAKLNATIEAVADLRRAEGRTKNWHLKSRAIIDSPFRQVLFLDSDNTPAVNPDHPSEGLFGSLAFRKFGLMLCVVLLVTKPAVYTRELWPDYWKGVAHNPAFQIMGTQARDEWETEAGQILIDKSRHLDILHLTDFMLQHHQVWFSMSDGDKDLFRFAALALRKRWAVPGRMVGAVTWSDGPADFCGHTHDHLGRPAFVHGNMLKKIGAGSVPTGEHQGQAWGLTRSFPAGYGPDGVTSCDELANVDISGRGIAPPSSLAVRKRAALALGIRTWFRGTDVYSTCLSVRWENPLEDTDQVLAKLIERTDKGRTDDDGLFTGSERDWRSGGIFDAIWADDSRLATFETDYFAAGGLGTAPRSGTQSFD